MSATMRLIHGPSEPPSSSATLGQLIDEQALQHGDRTSVIFPAQNVELSFNQLAARSKILAKALIAAGLKIWRQRWYICSQYLPVPRGILCGRPDRMSVGVLQHHIHSYRAGCCRATHLLQGGLHDILPWPSRSHTAPSCARHASRPSADRPLGHKQCSRTRHTSNNSLRRLLQVWHHDLSQPTD